MDLLSDLWLNFYSNRILPWIKFWWACSFTSLVFRTKQEFKKLKWNWLSITWLYRTGILNLGLFSISYDICVVLNTKEMSKFSFISIFINPWKQFWSSNKNNRFSFILFISFDSIKIYGKNIVRKHLFVTQRNFWIEFRAENRLKFCEKKNGEKIL